MPTDRDSVTLNLDLLERQIRAAESRIAALPERASEREGAKSTIELALQELDVTMEELRAADAELRAQGEQLTDAQLGAEVERRRYHDLFNFAPEAYVVTDLDGIIREANRAAALLFGVEQWFLQPKPLTVFLPDEDKRDFRARLARFVQTGENGVWECRIRPRIGERFDAELLVSRRAEVSGEPASLLWVVRNITQRKQLERQLRESNEVLEERVRERTSELAAADAVKSELLLREQQTQAELAALNESLERTIVETNHRVKNHLQAIAALIEMQAPAEVAMVPVVEILRLSQQIRALASVHDVLAQSTPGRPIGERVSSSALLERLLDLLRQLTPSRTVSAHVEDVMLTSRQATALSLVVNELVSNAMKHAPGAVDLTFSQREGRVVLEICDEGAGFGPDFDISSRTHGGLQLVNTLARWDLQGDISFGNRKGTPGGCVRVSFPAA